MTPPLIDEGGQVPDDSRDEGGPLDDRVPEGVRTRGGYEPPRREVLGAVEDLTFCPSPGAGDVPTGLINF